jgi:hypothetical protein
MHSDDETGLELAELRTADWRETHAPNRWFVCRVGAAKGSYFPEHPSFSSAWHFASRVGGVS